MKFPKGPISFPSTLLGACSGCIDMGFIASEKPKPLVVDQGLKFRIHKALENDN